MNIISTEQRLLPQAALPPPPRPPETMADAFGLNAALKMIRRRIILMMTIAAIVGALILTRSMMATPQYQAMALVAINARQERVLDPTESVLGDLPRDTAAIDTEIEILRSPALRSKLVDALGLTRDPEWNWMLR